MQVGSLKRPLEAPETVIGAADLEWGEGGDRCPGLAVFQCDPFSRAREPGSRLDGLGWLGQNKRPFSFYY